MQSDNIPMKLEFRRADRKPFKILVRGDCTSRRMINFNPEFFPDQVTVVQNEKSPLVLFLDSLNGTTVNLDILKELSDVDSMPAVLSKFYLSQHLRSILMEKDADLLIIDSYADQNFELYEHTNDKFKIWIHPKYLRNATAFSQTFKKIGRRTLQESVDDAVAFIEAVRLNNPDIPVLMLNQQVEFYPKLHSRMDYYELGKLVSKRLPGVRVARPLEKDELALADIGSCGPGLTLHWQKETYANMMQSAYPELNLQKPNHVSDITVEIEVAHTLAKNDSATLHFGLHSSDCNPQCDAFVARSLASLVRYAKIPTLNNPPPVLTPSTISTTDFRDFNEWEKHIKSFSSGNRIREKKKAQRLGFYTKQFSVRLHIPDIFEIDTSLDIRSGGAMRGEYIKTIEQRGGYPKQYMQAPTPSCTKHWGLAFGVFTRSPGYMQGEIKVDEKLLAYISLRRTGDLITYAQIIGHGSHLSDGVMILLHHDVVEWIGKPENNLTQGVSYLMYGATESGNDGLKNWKRRGGFTPREFTILS